VRLAFVALALTGCAQLLGLDNTKFDQRDAGVDAPSVCDGAPACVSSTGRSMCGQLMQTGAMAGTPLRLPSPTGQSCASLGSTEGPCALTIYGQAMASLFANNTADRIGGEIDDCGRFVVPDIDAAAKDVAVVVTGTDIEQSAAVLINRPTMPGTDTQQPLYVVATSTAQDWGTQIDPANPPSVTGSYLVTFETTSDMPYTLRVGGAAVGTPPTQPWGMYFAGTAPFGMLDPALMGSQANHSALVVPPTGSIQLGGQRTGKNCGTVTVQAVANTLIHVSLSC
jgi:hypothetical protein